MTPNKNILQAGTLLYNGKYRIESVIEEGGLGITYKATLVQLDVQVAVKELFLTGKCIREADNSISLKSFSEEKFKDFKNKFVEEGRSLAKFKHPNLVQVRDIIEENNTVYLIMDYVEDNTLEVFVQERGGKLPEDEALSYILQVASALDEVHTKGFLHKDICPANIMITDEGKAVLVGMGIAGQFVPKNQDSSAPSYAPMEQYIAQYTKMDRSAPSTDIYSLAGTLYFALLGTHPLSAVERQSKDLPPPQSVNPQLNNRTNNAIMKAMLVKQEERYQSITDFVAAVRPETTDAQAIGNTLGKGTRLMDGKYRIEETLSQGGLGITYKATLLRLDLPVVIKELFLPGYCVREAGNKISLQSLSEKEFNRFKKKFLHEGKILAQTKHDHIVDVKDVIQENNTVYLVMEHVEGRSMQDYVAKKGKLTEDKALLFIRQIATDLAKLHEKGFLHKDIRPENVVINRQGQAVLVGLGVEKDKVKNNNDAHEAGYFPMEQYASETELGSHTDVYALGATLYYALTGKRPTSAFDRYYTKLVAPKKIQPDVTKRSNHAIVKAMEMKVEHRYKNIATFLEDLKVIDPAVLRRQQMLRALSGVLTVLTIAVFSYFIFREPPPPTIAANEYGKYLRMADNLSKRGEYKEATRLYKGLLLVKSEDAKVLEAKVFAEKGASFSTEWWNNLETEWQTVFRKTIGFKGQPSQQQLSQIYQLEELYCYDTPINSLEPIENISNLKILGCYNTAISDLGPVRQLKQLQVLDCSSTPITSLAPLKGLSSLQTLDCSKTKIAALTPIQGLVNLKELYCSNTKVGSLTAVKSIKGLQKLHCAKTGIKNLEPIAHLNNLKELYIYNTQVKDLTALQKLSNLNTLHAYKTPISDLTALANLKNLQELHIYNSSVRNLNPIIGLTNLQFLDIHSNPIKDLTAVGALNNLSTLKCYNTQITDVSALSGLSNLKTLHCSKTPITDISPLASLRNLNDLRCSSTQINDLSALKDLKNLVTLHCSSTQVSDLAPISHLRNLQQLHCANIQIDGLRDLEKLTNLQVLDCSSTQITSLKPVKKLVNLTKLDCSSTQIPNLLPLENLNNLKFLDCSATPIASIEPIEGLNNLTTIKCDRTNLSKEEMAAFKSSNNRVRLVN